MAADRRQQQWRHELGLQDLVEVVAEKRQKHQEKKKAVEKTWIGSNDRAEVRQ